MKIIHYVIFALYVVYIITLGSKKGEDFISTNKDTETIPDKLPWYENKWIRAAIPALLIHCSIGTVYCWSIFKLDIANYIGVAAGQVEWGFSIAIFCLGISAAFGGHIIEKDIKKSSLIAAIFFFIGMVGTGVSIWMKSLLGICLFYGLIMGIGLGIGYLTPVKTLMQWFSKNKGLGTGLAVAGFGLAKVIASPVMMYLKEALGLFQMFFILGIIYLVMMMLGHFMIARPPGLKETIHLSKFKPTKILKNPVFIGIWIMFFLNITCGLAIISHEKDIYFSLVDIHGIPILSAATVAILLSFSAIFNASGRIGFASLSDRMKDRNNVYKIIFIISIISLLGVVVTDGINNSIVFLVVAMFFLINAGYGGGFSSVPPLLSDRFGMKTISRVHGLTLTAWAFAGLAGNQIVSFIVYELGQSYTVVLYVLVVLFVVALLSSQFLVRPGNWGSD